MSITFLFDENIPHALVDLLQQRGFDAQHLKKTSKHGDGGTRRWSNKKSPNANCGIGCSPNATKNLDQMKYL
jgi:hypothetical protein